MSDKSKDSRIAVRIDAGLHNWVKMYAQRENKTMSVLITEYLETLRRGEHVNRSEDHHKSFDQTELIEQLRSENAHIREQLVRRDEQIDHFQQIVAMSQKNIGALTEQLDDSRQMIEDMRQRPWWKQIFRR